MGDRRMASGGPGRVARGLLEAVFSNDFERAREYCSEDLVMTIEGIQTVRGHDGLRSLMDFVSEVATDVRTAIHHVLGAGEIAAINRTAHLTLGERTYTLEIGAFFTVRDGLVTEWTDYQDAQEVSRALGH